MEYYTNPNKALPIKKYKQVINSAIYGDKALCYCQPEIIKNSSFDSNSVYNTRSLRISNIVKNSRGGRLQFGNTYLGETMNDYNVNYLGNNKPFKNKF